MEKKFQEIINKWLTIRDSSLDKDLLIKPSIGKIPTYVLKMIVELDNLMPITCIEQILRLESTAAGHTDYVTKFSYYLTELYETKKDEV